MKILGKVQGPYPYTLVDKLETKDVKVASNRHYGTAHEEADKLEKKKYGRSYDELKHQILSMPKNQFMGMNTVNGLVMVSSIVPPKYREEVAFHEHAEHIHMMKLTNN